MRTNTPIIIALALCLLPGCTKKLEDEIVTLKSDLSSTRAAKEAAEKQLTQLKPEFASLQKQQVELTEQKNAANVQLANLSAENQALRTRVAELEDTIKKSLPPPSFDLQGEMFIATRGGTAYKLSSVQVFLVSRDEADAWISERKSSQAKTLKDLEPMLDLAKKEFEIAEAAYNQADANESKAFTAHLAAVFDKKLEAQWKAAQEQSNRLREPYFDKRGQKAKIEAALKYLLSGEFFFAKHPRHQSATRTNSEGRFKFNVPRGTEWVVVAQAQRVVGSSTESYYWAVPVSVPNGSSTEMLLSNGNLTSAGGESLFFSADS